MTTALGTFAFWGALLALALSTAPLHADGPGSADTDGPDAGESYFERVDRTQAEQPHWIPPLATTTPRLVDGFRYDVTRQSRPQDATLTNYGLSKGIEIIPADRVQLVAAIPPYQTIATSHGTTGGWSDATFLMKYRFAAENESAGNSIISGFLGVSVPTGAANLSTGRYLYTPTLAGGKGWGDARRGFDFQTNLGVTIPSGDRDRLGIPIVWNTAFQAHVFEEHLWPETELNLTHWSSGPNGGKTQSVITVGMVAGRFPIAGRARLSFGAGFQRAVGSFRTYSRAWIFSARLSL